MRSWKSFAWPARLTGKTLHEWLLSSKVAALSMFFLSLVIGGYLFLPVEAINKRLVYEIERQLPLDIAVETIRVLPLLTISGRDMEIELTEAPQYRFNFSNVNIDPWWSSLINGALGLEGTASGLGGNLDFRINSRRDFGIAAHGLQVDLPLQANISVDLAGTGINARLESSLPLHLAERHQLDFEADQLQVSGLGMFSSEADNISLGRVEIKASGQQGVLKIDEVLFSGGAVEASGSGEVLLAANLPDSRINLVLSIRPDPQLPSDLNSLLGFLGPKQRDRTYRMQLTGTLSRPVLK